MSSSAANVLKRATLVQENIANSNPIEPQINSNPSLSRSKRGVVSSDDPIKVEIFDENHPCVQSGKYRMDNDLTIAVKKLVQRSNVTRNRINKFIGEGGDKLFSNPNEAYNLEYGLRVGNRNCTFDYAQKWAIICGKPKIIINFE